MWNFELFLICFLTLEFVGCCFKVTRRKDVDRRVSDTFNKRKYSNVKKKHKKHKRLVWQNIYLERKKRLFSAISWQMQTTVVSWVEVAPGISPRLLAALWFMKMRYPGRKASSRRRVTDNNFSFQVQVSMMKKSTGGGFLGCGAILLSCDPLVVITAAHCVHGWSHSCRDIYSYKGCVCLCVSHFF